MMRAAVFAVVVLALVSASSATFAGYSTPNTCESQSVFTAVQTKHNPVNPTVAFSYLPSYLATQTGINAGVLNVYVNQREGVSIQSIDFVAPSATQTACDIAISFDMTGQALGSDSCQGQYAAHTSSDSRDIGRQAKDALEKCFVGSTFTDTSNGKQYARYVGTIKIRAEHPGKPIRGVKIQVSVETAIRFAFKFAKTVNATYDVKVAGNNYIEARIVEQDFDVVAAKTTLYVLTSLNWPYKLSLKNVPGGSSNILALSQFSIIPATGAIAGLASSLVISNFTYVDPSAAAPNGAAPNAKWGEISSVPANNTDPNEHIKTYCPSPSAGVEPFNAEGGLTKEQHMFNFICWQLWKLEVTVVGTGDSTQCNFVYDLGLSFPNNALNCRGTYINTTGADYVTSINEPCKGSQFINLESGSSTLGVTANDFCVQDAGTFSADCSLDLTGSSQIFLTGETAHFTASCNLDVTSGITPTVSGVSNVYFNNHDITSDANPQFNSGTGTGSFGVPIDELHMCGSGNAGCADWKSLTDPTFGGFQPDGQVVTLSRCHLINSMERLVQKRSHFFLRLSRS